MYVVVVSIDVFKDHLGPFMEHVRTQARNTLENEPGCHVFDVCVRSENPTSVLLYEVYDDADAFQHHLNAPYFADFDSSVRPMMIRKEVQTYTRTP